jgi:hypothetical protein
MDVQERNRRALAAVQERRDHFYEAIIELEKAMATAAGDEPQVWAGTAELAATAMRNVLRHHIQETEAPGSIYDDIVEHSPHLAHAAGKLQTEHAPLREAVDELIEGLASVRNDEDVERARLRALDVLRALLLHRQRGAELVFDAYNVDVATGD